MNEKPHPFSSAGGTPALRIRLKTICNSLLPVGLAIGLFVVVVSAQEKKHSDPAKRCVTAECHVSIVKHKYLHGPLAINECTVCHDLLPGNQHKFRLTEIEAKLCLTCHKRVDTAGLTLHDPVAKGKCLGCHDPHGSEEKFQVRKTPAAKLCNECHNKKPVITGKFVHTPAGRGECLACHRPHGSKAKKLLDATGRNLCLKKCHEKKRPVFVAGKEQKVHLTSEECTRCHRTHDSNYPSLLTRSSADLCLDGCHKEVKEDTSKFRHWTTEKASGCVGCHRAHDSTSGRLLRKPVTQLCLTCHEDLQAQIAAAKFRHRPVLDSSCRSCHLPHRSQHNKLLFADYPSTILSAYDPDEYLLCFACHKEGIVSERYVDSQTGFRNGRLNLHYLHVNRESGGHTCRTCHDWHASTQPALIREQAPSGIWVIPIKHTKSESGGSCLTGCHKEYYYDRINPVQLNAK